jgi:hypothetical protein
MAIFTDHKVQLTQLLKIIPEDLFEQLALDTKVDYYAKALHGKMLFYLLLYSLLMDDRLGQRGIADLYASPVFRTLFNLQTEKKTLSHSSISERLSKVKVEYFKQIYEVMYERYSKLYPAKTLAGLTLQRVDSSLVSEVSNKLKEGLTWGNENGKGKMVKYTMNYDGMYGSLAKVHTENKYANESIALPENVQEHFKKSKDHSNVYVLDRGQSSTAAFGEMRSKDGLLFVGRLLENRKFSVVREFDLTFKRFECGVLSKDAIVQLYGYEHVKSKTGKDVKKPFLAEEKYRVISFCPQGKKEDILLITNIFHLRAETIALMYRRRWDIEVFFRFLKQEINFGHFPSLNQNGMEVILYMTLIVAMMIMIYKKENDIGFKTAKRRMLMEVQEQVMILTATLLGGNVEELKKFGVSSP